MGRRRAEGNLLIFFPPEALRLCLWLALWTVDLLQQQGGSRRSAVLRLVQDVGSGALAPPHPGPALRGAREAVHERLPLPSSSPPQRAPPGVRWHKPPGVDQQVPWKGEAAGPPRGCLLAPPSGQRKKPDKLRHKPLQLRFTDLTLDANAYPSPHESNCGTHRHCPHHPSPSEGSLCSAQGEARAQGPLPAPLHTHLPFPCHLTRALSKQTFKLPPRTPQRPRQRGPRPGTRLSRVRG